MKFFVVLYIITFSTFTLRASAVKQVVIVASYEKGNVCGEPQEIGVLKGLSRLGWIEKDNMAEEFCIRPSPSPFLHGY